MDPNPFNITVNDKKENLSTDPITRPKKCSYLKSEIDGQLYTQLAKLTSPPTKTLFH